MIWGVTRTIWEHIISIALIAHGSGIVNKGPTTGGRNYSKSGCCKLAPKFIGPTSSVFSHVAIISGEERGNWSIHWQRVLLLAMNAATVATGMRANGTIFYSFSLGHFAVIWNAGEWMMLQGCTSIFMRLDAVVWKCQVHCILQLSALPVSRISQIFFLQPFFFSNHVHESKRQREKKRWCLPEQTAGTSIPRVNS